LRLLLAIFCFFPAFLPAQDAAEIIRRTIQTYDSSYKAAKSYMYLAREERRVLDGSGRVKERKVNTYEVTNLEGSPYRRLVGRNDTPLSPEEAKLEQQKLQSSIEERRKETPQQRSKRIADYEQRQEERRHDFVIEIPAAFNFRIVGEDASHGAPAWIIQGTPKPGFKGRSRIARAAFSNVNCKFWVSKKDDQAQRIEMDIFDTVSFGWLLVRLSKGSRVVVEQTPVEDGLWFPKKIMVDAAAKIMLIKSYRMEMLYDYSGYKKFQAESRIIETDLPK
jgi:hypothetical protein